MADTTPSANMSLPIPVVGTAPGPQYATDLNSCLTTLDAHDHSSGSGVPITADGINITSDLPFNGNSLNTLKKVGMTSQPSALVGTNFLSNIGGNLYYNDSSGNQIAMTASGGVAGSPGSISGLASPASASYSAGSKLFTWQSGVNKAGAMDNGAVTIRETDVLSAKGVTLLSPTALAADYNLTLPAALPASTRYLNSDTSGNMGFATPDTIGAAMTSTGANAIAGNITTTASVWTPTVTTFLGSLSAVVKSCSYYQIGSLVVAFFSITFNQVTQVSNYLILTLPVTSAGNTAGSTSTWNSLINGGILSAGINNSVATTLVAGVYSGDRTLARVGPVSTTGGLDNWNVGPGVAQGIIIYTAA